jgi:TonB family protein
MPRTLTISLSRVFILFFLAANAMAQSQTDSRRIIISGPRPHVIPNAVQPYTPDEQKWWQELRDAAIVLQKGHSGKKETQLFMDLLLVGHDKSYQPPIADSKPFILKRTPPGYGNQARSERISGLVQLRVELRPDGYVGEVEIVKGLGHGLDERAADAARRTIFIPAVKDRQFVVYKVLMEMSFNVY